MIERGVPVHWVARGASDSTNLKVGAKNEATDEDLSLLQSAASDGSQKDAIVIKEEVKTPEEIAIEKAKAFKATAGASLRRFQEFVIESKTLAGLAEGEKYAEGLAQDNGKHLVKLTKCVKILEAMVTGKATKDDELPKLIETVESLSQEHAEIQSWAGKFGLNAAANKKRRKTNK